MKPNFKKKVIVKRNKYIHPSVFGYVKNSANFIKLREKRPFNNILVEIYDRNKIFKGRTSSFDLYNTRQKKILSWRPFEFATINFWILRGGGRQCPPFCGLVLMYFNVFSLQKDKAQVQNLTFNSLSITISTVK